MSEQKTEFEKIKEAINIVLDEFLKTKDLESKLMLSKILKNLSVTLSNLYDFLEEVDFPFIDDDIEDFEDLEDLNDDL